MLMKWRSIFVPAGKFARNLNSSSFFWILTGSQVIKFDGSKKILRYWVSILKPGWSSFFFAVSDNYLIFYGG